MFRRVGITADTHLPLGREKCGIHPDCGRYYYGPRGLQHSALGIQYPLAVFLWMRSAGCLTLALRGVAQLRRAKGCRRADRSVGFGSNISGVWRSW